MKLQVGRVSSALPVSPVSHTGFDGACAAQGSEHTRQLLAAEKGCAASPQASVLQQAGRLVAQRSHPYHQDEKGLETAPFPGLQRYPEQEQDMGAPIACWIEAVCESGRMRVGYFSSKYVFSIYR